MKRKIVQHGSSSLTVSLPYKWTQKYNLKKGDEIDLELIGKSILIKIDKREKRDLQILKFKNDKFFFRRHLLNLYKKGYDEIRLEFNEQPPIDSILEKMDELLGFEIVEQGDKSCIIKNVASVIEEEFDTMLKRLFTITLSMGKELLEALDKKNYGRLEKFKKVEKENNRLVNYCHRVLNKSGFDNLNETTKLYSIIDRLEIIADTFRDAAFFISKNNVNLSEKTINYLKQVNSYFEDVIQTFYSFRADKMPYLKDTRLKLFDDFLELAKKSGNKELVALHFLRQIAEEVHHIEFSLI